MHSDKTAVCVMGLFLVFQEDLDSPEPEAGQEEKGSSIPRTSLQFCAHLFIMSNTECLHQATC